jgi:alpha-galactosidase
MKRLQGVALLSLLTFVGSAGAQGAGEILTPPPPDTPRINGARVYGQRPGRPFLFTIPVTGQTPIQYSAEGLPDGLTIAHGGHIVGVANTPGEYKVILTASNSLGSDTKPLLIKIGDQISLTPPMGWNSWNCFAGAVDQEKVTAQADAMVSKGLIKHGWTYINIDDTWQGERGGQFHGLLANEKFPDMKGLCDHVHSLGLKAGIYSTPWAQSYAGYAGSSSDNAEGVFKKAEGAKQVNRNVPPWAEGKYHFYEQDAKQWADWGFDYLKYDWNPIIVPQVQSMGDALKNSGRDFVYSLSNSTPFAGAADWARLANLWRTSGDIRDNWTSMTRNAMSADKWNEFAGPGHWNDPDMLVVGMVGWGPKLHPTELTPDEQYTHITYWSLFASPLLIGCDMTQLDDFTTSLLSNDEVLAVDQDALGKQAKRVGDKGNDGTEVWAKPLADGTVAVGLFNRGRYELLAPARPKRGQPATERAVWKVHDRLKDQSTEFDTQAEAAAALKPYATAAEVTVSLADLNLNGSQPVRDLWRQKDLPAADGKVTLTVPFHGAAMLKIGTPHE